MSADSPNPRYLIVIIGSLVVCQLLLAGVFGFKPSFRAGYFMPPVVDTPNNGSTNLSQQRRLELEALLLPPPNLTWTDESVDGALPLGSKAVDGIISDGGNNIKIKPVYFENLPDLKSLTVDERKKSFTAVLLPLILRANNELIERRTLIIKDAERGDLNKLRQWAELYRIKIDDADIDELRDVLLLRVDKLPVSLALAQSAIESGWGTSRFAVKGNALFGQWAWSNDQGLKPAEARYDNAVVRSFSNLFDSVRAYMHNLNTHPSYENFRRLRQREEIDINTLTSALDSYSEEGDIYIEKLRSMVEVNEFTLFDNAELLSE